MPTYDYECDKCHHRFELRQSFHSDPTTPCLMCGSSSSRRFHSVAVIYKGSGWYSKDYGKGGASSAKDSSPEEKPKSETKSENAETKSENTETKTEVKKESESVKTAGD